MKDRGARFVLKKCAKLIEVATLVCCGFVAERTIYFFTGILYESKAKIHSRNNISLLSKVCDLSEEKSDAYDHTKLNNRILLYIHMRGMNTCAVK